MTTLTVLVITQDEWNLECPKPSTCYYVQVETGGLSTCDEAEFTMAIEDNGYQKAEDSICNASDLGTLSDATTGAAGIDSDDWSNRCLTDAPGEPGTGGGDATAWYTFNTGYDYIDADGDSALWHSYALNITQDADIDVYFGLYEASSDAPITICEDFSTLSLIAEEGNIESGAVSLCLALQDAEETRICLKPNTRYYLQVQGFDFCGDEGEFDIAITPDYFLPPDQICDAMVLDNAVTTATGTVNAVTGTFAGYPTYGLDHANWCATNNDSISLTDTTLNEQNAETYLVGDPQTVWYKFKVDEPAPEYIDIDVNSNDLDGCLLFQGRVNVYVQLPGDACNYGFNRNRG